MPDYAIYGIHFYGTAVYGLPPTFEYSLNRFEANPDGYDRIKVEWNNPSGDWDLMRLVRGNYGFPTEFNDGHVLLEASNVTPGTSDPMVEGYSLSSGTVEDTSVSPLRFHYYTMFLRQTVSGDWRRAGNVVALMPQNFQYTERLYELTPGIFRDEDIFVSQTSGQGMLQTFYGIFGYWLDQMRSELESLRWTANPERMSGGLLPYMAKQLGFPYEAELGGTLVRRQLLNAVYLYKMKGTRLGVEGAVSVLTGWAATLEVDTPGHLNVIIAAERVNLIENPSAETNVSGWTGTNATIARDTTQFQYGEASFRLTAAATGDMSMTSPAGTAGMPVTPGNLYTGSAGVFKATGTARQIRADLLWYDDAGDPLGDPVLGSEVTQVLGTWMRPAVGAVAPPGAATAALRPVVLAAGTGENQFIDGALFERGGLADYFDASTGSPIADYLWDGTAHLSRSHYYSRRAIKNSRLVTRLDEFLPAGMTFTPLYGEPV